MYSLFSVSCFLTFLISGLTSLLLEILKLSTFGTSFNSVFLRVFLTFINLVGIFFTTTLVFFVFIFLVFLTLALTTFLALDTFLVTTFFFAFFSALPLQIFFKILIFFNSYIFIKIIQQSNSTKLNSYKIKT